MKIEIMIYTYIAICVSMILYNIIYVFILKHRERALVFDSEKLKKILNEQIDILKKGEEISEKHNALVSESNCDYVQGWYYSKALPIEECESFINKYTQN